MSSRTTRALLTRSQRNKGKVQAQRGGFVTEAEQLQPYGLEVHLPEDAKLIMVEPDGEPNRLVLLGYTSKHLALNEGEVALNSEHGQQIYLKEDGTLHIEATGLLSLQSKEEDLYSLLKDLLAAIKSLQTAQIYGGTGLFAPRGPVSGTIGNIGISPQSSQKLDDIAQRLDKLLQKGEKAEAEEGEQ